MKTHHIKHLSPLSFGLGDLFGGLPGLGGGGGGGGQGANGTTGGFFGSGGTSSQEQTNTNTQNTQVTTSGPTVFGNGDITTTDFGAVTAAIDIGHDALQLGGDAISDSLARGESVAIAGLDNAVRQLNSSFGFGSDVVRDSLNFSGDTTTRAFNFGGDALESAVSGIGRANETIERFAGRALDSNNDAFAGILDFASNIVGTALNNSETLTDQANSANASLARQVSQSATQSVNDSLVKLATVAAIAVAAIFIFRSK